MSLACDVLQLLLTVPHEWSKAARLMGRPPFPDIQPASDKLASLIPFQLCRSRLHLPAASLRVGSAPGMSSSTLLPPPWSTGSPATSPYCYAAMATHPLLSNVKACDFKDN